MDLDALHRHMTEFKQMKPRLLKMLEFVEGIMTSGMMPAGAPAAATPDTTVTDRISALEKFREEALPVLDKVPAFLELAGRLEGVDFGAIEERLTTVEGSVQEIAAALDPNAQAAEGPASGQEVAPVDPAASAATEQPVTDPNAPAAS